ncbi:MAG: cytoskeleton protein RodZ [Polaromonas sp.]|jgi:cytoskeleton protein RodZ
MTDDKDQSSALEPVVQAPVVQAPVVAESVSESKPTAGALMRHAREASGLHIGALAVSLKVPVKRLEALEADRIDLLPDAVFARALASSVCRTLKLDSAPILQLMPSQSSPRGSQPPDNRRVIHGATISSRRLPLSGTMSRPAVIGGLLLVLGALALAWLPPLNLSRSPVEAVDGESVVTQTLPVMALEPSGPELVADAKANLSASANSSATVSGLVVPAANMVETGVPPASGIVLFKPTAESWVEVTDAKRVVLLRRKLAAGEVAGASGALPLSVIVGRADVTSVQIRGQAFDLTPVSRDNVARFEVK